MKKTIDFFTSLFKNTTESVWKNFASQHGGSFVPGQYDIPDRVEIDYRGHTIIFDSYIHYAAQARDVEFTRVRLIYPSSDDFKFRLMNQGIIDTIGKLFGAQDLEIGDKAVDDKFVIKGNDLFRIQSIFLDEKLKSLLLAQKDIVVQICDEKGLFDEVVPDNHRMLYYISENCMREVNQAADLLEMFKRLADLLTDHRVL